MAALLGLSLVGTGCPSQAMYGAPITDSAHPVDHDGDGWFASEGDCDDEDAEINPDATETPGDGVDSNCDEADDT